MNASPPKIAVQMAVLSIVAVVMGLFFWAAIEASRPHYRDVASVR